MGGVVKPFLLNEEIPFSVMYKNLTIPSKSFVLKTLKT
jgi:hypothetical protein